MCITGKRIYTSLLLLVLTLYVYGQSASEPYNEVIYPNGSVIRKYLPKEEFIITAGNPVKVVYLQKYFRANGMLQSEGYMGDLLAQIVNVGEWCSYDENGKLIEWENYIYPKQPEHVTSQYDNPFYYFIRKEFYPEGQLKSEVICANWWENDFPHTPIGTWTYYDEQGDIIKTEKYTDFEPYQEVIN